MIHKETSLKTIEILMVEDSPSDALITREAFEYGKALNHLHVVEDGVRALAFLRRESPYAQVPRPALILVDLNLPKKDGCEVLAEVKADDQLKNISVVVLTTWRAEADILRAYGLHANGYITKTVDFVNVAEAVRSIEHFWFTVVNLPPGA